MPLVRPTYPRSCRLSCAAWWSNPCFRRMSEYHMLEVDPWVSLLSQTVGFTLMVLSSTFSRKERLSSRKREK